MMLYLSLILTCLVVAEGPLKVMISMGLGTNSHIKLLLETGTILRERNHTVFYSSFDSNKKFNKPYRLPFVSLGNDTDAQWNKRSLMKEGFAKRVRPNPSKEMTASFGSIVAPIYDFTYPTLLRIMNQERPDVVLCDFIATACRDAAQMLSIPLVTGFQATDFFGVINSPFITTDLAYGSITTEDMNFFQRFQSKVIYPLLDHYYHYSLIKATNIVRAKYGVPPASTPFGDFSVSLGLSSSFVGFEAPMNFSPHIKIIGPIKSKINPPLTPELTEFLETHPKTLYIAFGSLVILAEFDIENLVLGCLQALAEGSIDGVIWGLGSTIREDFPEVINFDGTEISRKNLFSGELPQIQLLDWAPQTSILEHESTKLFISHGGLESSFEAILSGTPILCMPFLGDQFRNARKLEDAGIAKYIDRIEATPVTISYEIKSFIKDPSGNFAANVKRMRTIAQYASQRKESGADAVEEYAYIAQACRPLQNYKFGDVPCEIQHLTQASRSMSFVKANLIDVYAFAILTTFFITLGLTYFGWRLVSILCLPPKEDFEKKDK